MWADIEHCKQREWQQFSHNNNDNVVADYCMLEPMLRCRFTNISLTSCIYDFETKSPIIACTLVWLIRRMLQYFGSERIAMISGIFPMKCLLCVIWTGYGVEFSTCLPPFISWTIFAVPESLIATALTFNSLRTYTVEDFPLLVPLWCRANTAHKIGFRISLPTYVFLRIHSTLSRAHCTTSCWIIQSNPSSPTTRSSSFTDFPSSQHKMFEICSTLMFRYGNNVPWRICVILACLW